MVTSAYSSDDERLPFLSLLIWLQYRKMRDAPNEQNETSMPKSEYHKLATSVANRIITLDRSSSVTHLARGELSVLVGDFDRGLDSFKTVLSSSGNSNLFGHLGKARVLYNKKNYKAALKLYQLILKSRPYFQPDPRIGIGLCFWQLNDKDMAHAAWQRALELNPECISVNVLLGLYYMDEAVKNVEDPSFEATYIKALKFTQVAYKANPNYPPADLTLASYLFSKHQTDAVIKLTQRAIDYSNVKSVISDAYFWMARAYHYLDNLEEAYRYYKMAEESNGGNLVAKIGKGLVQMAQNDNETLYTFEKIVQAHPKSSEALFLLALSYVQQWQANPNVTERDYKNKAIVYLEKYMRLAKEQDEAPPIETLLTLAKLTEESNTTTSLKTLNDVIQLLNTQDLPVQAELYNNIGVLHYTKGSYESARSFFELALTSAQEGHSFSGSGIETSIKFNLARLEDADGKIELARKLYDEVLAMHPDYLAARIRSIYLSLALGETDSPAKVKELMAQHPNDLEVRSLYGYYLKRQRRPPAKSINDDVEMKHHKHTLVNIDKHDSYSLVAMGNMYLSVARGLRINSDSDIQKKEWTYSKAAELFEKALLVDKFNAFAAQGVGIIFAETKQSDKALHIFSKIRETLNDVSIYVNMGDCLVDLRQYSKAIECYEIALNRYRNGNDPQLLILLGRAWYARGMNEKSMEALKTSLSYSERASEAMSDNTGLKFNVAFVKFQMADFVLKMPERQRTTVDIEKAIKGLQTAITSMKEIAKTRHPPYPASDLEQRANMGQNTIMKQLDRALIAQKEYEEKFHDKIDQAKKLREAEKAQLEAERAAKAKAEKEREEMLIKERMLLQEQAREWTEQAAERMANEGDDDDERGEPKRQRRPRGEGRKARRAPREKSSKRSNGSSSAKKSKKGFKSMSDIEDSDDGLDDFDDDDGAQDELSDGEETAKETESEGEGASTKSRSKSKSKSGRSKSKSQRSKPKPSPASRKSRKEYLSKEFISDSDDLEDEDEEAGEADKAGEDDVFGDDKEENSDNDNNADETGDAEDNEEDDEESEGSKKRGVESRLEDSEEEDTGSSSVTKKRRLGRVIDDDDEEEDEDME